MALDLSDVLNGGYYYPTSTNGYQSRVLRQDDKSIFENQDYGYENSDLADGEKDDGVISAGEMITNFGKGLVKPITSMFESPSNFLTGAAMIAGGAALCVATGGAAAPFLVAAGLGMGAYNFGHGAYKAATAKTDQEAIEAWQSIGEGVSLTGLSVLGAKPALNGAGVRTGSLNPLQATVRCVGETPNSIKNSINAFQTGKYKSNFGISSHSFNVKPTQKPQQDTAPVQHAEAQPNKEITIQPAKPQPTVEPENTAKISELEQMIKAQEKKNAEFYAKQEQEQKYAQMKEIIAQEQAKQAKSNSQLKEDGKRILK